MAHSPTRLSPLFFPGARAAVFVAFLLLVLIPALPAAWAGPPPLLPAEAVAALAGEISGTAALHTAQELTLYHRMRGSRGFRAAAEAVREHLEVYGLSRVEILELPADGERFYGTQRSRPAWDADFAELWELAPPAGDESGEGGAWKRLRRVASWEDRPVTLAQDSLTGAATADLVDIGAGTSTADYAGKEVAGKLVLTSSQPGAVAALAVGEHGAAGIISWAQNQKSAWWGEDGNLVRWGHLATFDGPDTFAFMVSPNQARAWAERLAGGERVRLEARVEAGRHPGVYAIATAVLPGADPDYAAQEILFSCHLDHLRPGANDNASGCAAILEAARALAKLVREGRLPPPRRTLRFIWPPEIEGTLALTHARPDLVARTRAVLHLDMVGGNPETTKAIFHITRGPASLPSFVHDVAEAFGRFLNEETYAHAATGRGRAAGVWPFVAPGGSRQALQARFAPFSMGSDHEAWTEGSFRIPAIYLNDWPDRHIHTDADTVAQLDPTKLLRAAFLAAASGYYLADLAPEDVPALLAVVQRQALDRTRTALTRAAELPPAEAKNLLDQHLAYERGVLNSIGAFAPAGAVDRDRASRVLGGLWELVGAAGPGEPAPPEAGAPEAGAPEADAGDADLVCWRHREPKGTLWGFGYSYLEDQLARRGLARPGLLGYSGRWGEGSEYAYEVLNRVDGRASAAAVRDAVAATYGPVPLELVTEYLRTLESIGLLACGGDLPGRDWTRASTAPLAARLPGFFVPEDPAELGISGFAKILCSAVFVSGREPEEAAVDSAFFFLPGQDLSGVTERSVDRERREVRATWQGRITRTARAYGDQGCVILPRGATEVSFAPVPVVSTLPEAAQLPWPMGDRLEEGLPAGLDRQALEAAADAAFGDPEAYTAAFLAVHRGRIVVERYAPGIDLGTQLESWSMGKSLAATLLGRLIHEGEYRLDEPVPIPAWRQQGDPRGEIRIADLLRMSSGLHFIAPQAADYAADEGYPEHMFIYTGAVDACTLAITRPAQFPAGTEGRYRNADPLVVGCLVAEVARRRGENPLSFPQRLLFDRIGIRRQVLEPDPWGNLLLSGYDYGTARGWARIGLLYLRDGVFEGERLLPEGWAKWVATPAPAWDPPVYGGFFWLNTLGQLAVPEDAYWAAGAGGQYTVIIPSLDLVVVRLGHLRGGPHAGPTLNAALEKLVMAIGGTSP